MITVQEPNIDHSFKKLELPCVEILDGEFPQVALSQWELRLKHSVLDLGNVYVC